MPNDLPAVLQKYSQSPVFNQSTIPDALRRDHSTKAGIWGQIVVSQGALIYLRDDRPAQIVDKAHPATIYPEELHSVQPKGDVEFRVEFYRRPGEEDAA